MQQAGAKRIYLHGCVQCNKHVWAPNDPSDVCQLCGGKRYNNDGKPQEFIVHFPLINQFKSLLTCEQYQEAVRWECRRSRQNPAYMCGNFFYLYELFICYLIVITYICCLLSTDVYDSSWWQEFMGPVNPDKLTRMGLLMCVDAVPAFNHKQKNAVSMMPTDLINLSLPAHLRYDPDNMMIWLLIPSEMSADTQLKYFNYLVKTELNPLLEQGVPGPDGPVLIKLYGAALDLKGKEKFYNQVILKFVVHYFHSLFSFTISIHYFHSLFLFTIFIHYFHSQQQESVTGYCGCSTCLVHFDQGPGGPIRAASRRMLPADHPLRQQRATFRGQSFHFHNTEIKGEPKVKTTQTLFNLLNLCKRHGVTHYLGQKGPPMLISLKGFHYAKFNLLEWMHNLGRSFDCLNSFLVGIISAPTPPHRSIDTRTHISR